VNAADTFLALARFTAVPGSTAARTWTDEAARLSIDWNDLAEAAEHHGLEPLVLAHIREGGLAIPEPVLTRLRGRCAMHAHAADVREAVAARLHDAFDAGGVPCLLLKGAALAQLVYPRAALRPMRDLDLLIRGADRTRARAVLARAGFEPGGAVIPPEHQHGQPMHLAERGAIVTVELHHQLLRPTPLIAPLRYECLVPRAQPCRWGAATFRTLAPEDMLWHVYAHAFAIDVLNPAIRLISVADLTHAVEHWVQDIDWDRLAAVYPRLWRALAVLDVLTPWSSGVRQRLPRVRRTSLDGVGPLEPRRSWRQAFRREVVWPTDWWFRIRYGVDGPAAWLWYRAAGHPLRLALAAADGIARRVRPHPVPAHDL